MNVQHLCGMIILSDQEFATALPHIQADIASFPDLPGREWNAKRSQITKATFAMLKEPNS